MSRKAHNVDKQRTIEAGFYDGRSYWTNTGLVFLFGDDMRTRRSEIYERDKGMCQDCNQKGIYHRVPWNSGHMHHIKSRGLGGDDSLDNLEWLGPECHLYRKHVQVRLK